MRAGTEQKARRTLAIFERKRRADRAKKKGEAARSTGVAAPAPPPPLEATLQRVQGSSRSSSRVPNFDQTRHATSSIVSRGREENRSRHKRGRTRSNKGQGPRRREKRRLAAQSGERRKRRPLPRRGKPTAVLPLRAGLVHPSDARSESRARLRTLVRRACEVEWRAKGPAST